MARRGKSRAGKGKRRRQQGVSARGALTLNVLIEGYLEDYVVRRFRSVDTARGRVAHLRAFFGGQRPVKEISALAVREYQLHRGDEGAAAATINRETSALRRMHRLAVQWGWLDDVPVFPGRLVENPPRQGFFEHAEYLAVRAALPGPYQDVLDFAYYSGWRKHEILNLTWDEVDLDGQVVRLSPYRSKTREGRVLPLSSPLAAVLTRRQAVRRVGSPDVFHRGSVTVRVWRTAWRRACRQAGVPTRLLHDCRRTAARNLIRAGIPERVAMVLTGHKTRAVFDRYNIVNEEELLAAGDRLATYLTGQASKTRVA